MTWRGSNCRRRNWIWNLSGRRWSCSDTCARLISLPMTFFAQRRVGELASRLSADLIQIEDTLTTILPQFLRQSTLLVGGISLIAVTSLQLTGIMLLSLPLVIAVAVMF